MISNNTVIAVSDFNLISELKKKIKNNAVAQFYIRVRPSFFDTCITFV